MRPLTRFQAKQKILDVFLMGKNLIINPRYVCIGQNCLTNWLPINLRFAINKISFIFCNIVLNSNFMRNMQGSFKIRKICESLSRVTFGLVVAVFIEPQHMHQCLVNQNYQTSYYHHVYNFIISSPWANPILGEELNQNWQSNYVLDERLEAPLPRLDNLSWGQCSHIFSVKFRLSIIFQDLP